MYRYAIIFQRKVTILLYLLCYISSKWLQFSEHVSYAERARNFWRFFQVLITFYWRIFSDFYLVERINEGIYNIYVFFYECIRVMNKNNVKFLAVIKTLIVNHRNSYHATKVLHWAYSLMFSNEVLKRILPISTPVVVRL